MLGIASWKHAPLLEQKTRSIAEAGFLKREWDND